MTERCGLYCTCGAPLNSRMVAESYPMDGGGHRRRRVCDSCGGDAVSVEWVVGVKAGPMFLVHFPNERRGPGRFAALRSVIEGAGGTVVKL